MNGGFAKRPDHLCLLFLMSGDLVVPIRAMVG
jgi:hypothetical protein